MAKKHKLFTPEGHEIIVAKRGKHKFFINSCTGQVIMVNPIPLIPLALAAAPTIARGVAGLFKRKGQEQAGIGSDTVSSPAQKFIYDSLDKPNKSERYVNLALR